jgi:hypothetical protein
MQSPSRFTLYAEISVRSMPAFTKTNASSARTNTFVLSDDIMSLTDIESWNFEIIRLLETADGQSFAGRDQTELIADTR